MEIFFIILGSMALITVTVILAAVLNGWILSILWGWFVVQIFHLPEISIIQAIGIALLIGYLTKTLPSIKDTDAKQFWINDIVRILYPFVVLLMGYIVHCYMVE